MKKQLLRLSTLCLLLILGITQASAEWTWRDFEIDLIGDLLTADEKVQNTELNFGVIIAEDGKQTRVAADNVAANVALSGVYHNDHGWRNFKAVVPVEGSVRITMSTCSWGGDVTVKNAAGSTVATFSTQKGEGGSGCYGGGMSSDPNIVSAEYIGSATTLTISGGNYVNYFAIEAIKGDDPVAQDVTATWDFANNCANLAPKSEGGSYTAETMASDVEGINMEIVYNGGSIKNNDNSYQVTNGVVMKIPVKNAGDLITVKGYPGYSKYTISGSTEELTGDNTYKAKSSDVEAGSVAITSKDGNNYYLSISVVQYAPKEKITLDNEPAIATFPFNEGTEGQKATFSNADYFLSSKVTYGSNLTLKDKNTLKDVETEENVTMTRFEPTNKLDTPDEASAVRFSFTPKPGFTFQPTKVALKVSRYGTDNGLVDVTWEVSDGRTMALATEVKPARNNKTPNVSKLSYDITDGTVTEGTQTLLLHLYSMQSSKQFGLADIVIEGILNGTEKDVPVLASFKINGNTYEVEEVFGEQYEATLELPKAEQMVGQQNPLTDVTAKSGEVGEITYEGTETTCKVTIPMTAGDTQMDYLLNVVYKPDFTLSYIAVDGTTVLETQTVEKDAKIGAFAYDIANVPSLRNGYKARGWFKQNVVGAKFTTEDVITGDTKLYAVETEIEYPSNSRKYVYDLTDKYFYDEDHEGFNSIGSGYWHDAQHG